MVMASVGLLAGGSLSNSGVITDWPGLGKKDQFEKRDLMATTDYRSVCAACIEKSLGLDHDLIAAARYSSNQSYPVCLTTCLLSAALRS